MLKLVAEFDPILKQKAENWDFKNNSNAADIEREMLELMKARNGIGLAANQVGLLHRVFVMQTQDGREFSCFNPYVLQGDNNFVEQR